MGETVRGGFAAATAPGTPGFVPVDADDCRASLADAAGRA
jgi:hypothetical protein